MLIKCFLYFFLSICSDLYNLALVIFLLIRISQICMNQLFIGCWYSILEVLSIISLNYLFYSGKGFFSIQGGVYSCLGTSLFFAHRGGWMICHFLNILSPFCFLLIEFDWIFSISYKILQYYLFIIVFWLGCDRVSRLLIFVPALLLSILMPLFLPSLSYFILAVPMRECLGKHSCRSSPCPITILNATCLSSLGKIVCLGRSFIKIKLI